MICMGIDVTKDKHDCFMHSPERESMADVFAISNNAEDFGTLSQTIRRCARPAKKLGLRLPDITPTVFSDFCSTKVYPPMLSIRCTQSQSEPSRNLD